ncbi:MAG TPA: RNA-binding protein [bacterium]|nr:RNA-binding protein [bacterium]HPT30174.1 RNA-binding protein [bacterium]
MSKKLYVGGIPYSMDNDALKEAFVPAGNVLSAMVIIDKRTNRSKGFGFVEMATDEEAQNAISMFNGQEIGGRKVIVNEARPMEERPRFDNRY